MSGYYFICRSTLAPGGWRVLACDLFVAHAGGGRGKLFEAEKALEGNVFVYRLPVSADTVSEKAARPLSDGGHYSQANKVMSNE